MFCIFYIFKKWTVPTICMQENCSHIFSMKTVVDIHLLLKAPFKGEFWLHSVNFPNESKDVGRMRESLILENTNETFPSLQQSLFGILAFTYFQWKHKTSILFLPPQWFQQISKAHFAHIF